MIGVSVLREIEIQKAIEGNMPYDDDAMEEWEEHFKNKGTAELVEIKLKCEEKYLNSHYPTVLLEQIIALRNVLQERMKRC